MKIVNPFSVLVLSLLTLLFNPSKTIAQSECGSCTDPLACNFNSLAIEDDGSCYFAAICTYWAADDEVCIDLGETIDYDVLCNDGFGDIGSFFVESDPAANECFSISPDGQVIQNNFTEMCCGEHMISYYLTDGTGVVLTSTATLIVTVKCTPKPDCSIIDLETMIGDIDGSGTIGVIDCFEVCENSVSTLQFPYNPLFTYDWVDVVGGVGNPGNNPAELIVSWDANGAGFVTLDVFDANMSPTTYNFCVTLLKGPTADFTVPSIVCSNTPICVDNLSLNADSYHWDFGDPLTTADSFTTSEPCYEYTVAGTYTITLTATKANYDDDGNPLCCCTDVITQTVEVQFLPAPNIYWVSTLCEGDVSEYWTDELGCSGYIWTVTDANGLPVPFTGQDSMNISVSWGAGPIGKVTLETIGCSTCPIPASVVVPIIPIDGVVEGPTLVCENTTETYCVPKWQSTTYNWTVSGGTITSASNGNCVNVSWDSTGAGVIQVDYTSDFLAGLPNHSAGDCSGSALLNVDIFPAYDVINTGAQTVCLGDVSIIQASSAINPNCNWTVPGHSFVGDGTNQITISWMTAGTYTIEAIPNNPMDYCNGPESILIQVQETPAPTAIEGPLSVCANSTHYYSIPSPDPSVTYHWSAVNGNLLSTTGTSVGVDWLTTSTQFELTVYAQSNSPAECISPDFTIDIDQKEIIQPLGITAGSSCSNTTSSYSLTAEQDTDAIITWSVSPAIAGSVLIQNESTTDIIWNDWEGSAEITVEVELCGNSVIQDITVLVTKPIIPMITQTGILCPGVSATLSTTLAFDEYAWSNGSDDPSISISSQGNYWVTTMDGNGCFATSSFDANQVPGPTAAISTGDPATICLQNPHTVTLIAQYNSNNTYQWHCNGLNVPGATDDTYDHFLQNAEGFYSYFVEVEDTNTGCISTSNIITIEESDCIAPPPCDPESHSFAIVSSQNQSPNCNVIDLEAFTTNATFGSWVFGDATVSGSNPVSHAYTTAGCYYVTATGSVPDINGNGNCSVADAVTVCVPVAAEFDYAFLSCTEVKFNEFATYLNTDPGNTITSYLWDFNGYGTSIDLNPTFDFDLPLIPPGTHPVTLTVTTQSGCQASITHNVFIDSVGATNLTVLTGPTCVGDPINMSALASAASEYNWDFGDAASFVGANTAHTYTTPGTYVITAISSNEAGCSSTASVPITIFPAIPDLTISANPGLTICEGETTVLTAPAGYSYLWSPMNSTNQSITVGPGIYSVFISDANGCESLLEEVEVVELQIPNAIISGNPYICDDGCTTLSVPSGTGLTYQWYYQFGTLAPMGTSNELTVCTPLASSQYYVEVTDQNGCTSVSSLFEVFVEPSPSFFISVAPSIACAGELNTLTVVGSQSNESYVWSDGTTGTVTTTTQAGTYYVTGTNNVTGCSHTASIVIHPKPNLCLAPAGCYTACEPYEICAPSGFAQYVWIKDGVPVSLSTSPCYTATTSGTYTVEVQSSFGCFENSDPLVLELIPCDDCDDLFVDFAPIVENNIPNDCCFDFIFAIGSTIPLQGVSLSTLDAELTFDASSIYPDLAVSGSTPNSVDLSSFLDGVPLPSTVSVVALSLCIENVINSPQTIYIDWYDFNNNVVCQDSLEWNCPPEPEPDCVYISNDNIYCNEMDEYIYEFTVCNSSQAPWQVDALYLVNDPMGTAMETFPASQVPPTPILQGTCQTFSTMLTGLPGEEFCYTVVGVNDSTFETCESQDTYCITLPACNPCEFQWAGAVPSGPDDCCFDISFTNGFTEPLQGLTIYSSDADFIFDTGTVHPSLSFMSNAANSVSLEANGDPLPMASIFNAITLCPTNIYNNPQTFYVDWYDFANNVVCQDSIIWDCPNPNEPDCLYLLGDSIYCNDLNEIIYDFTVCNSNNAPWAVDGFYLMNDPMGEAMEAFPSSQAPSTPIVQGTCQSFSTTLVGLPGEEFCYKLVAVEGTTGVTCESEDTYCVELPDCNLCDNLWTGFSPSGIGDCCFDIYFSNGAIDPLQGISIFVSGADVTIDTGTIHPSLNISGMTANSFNIEANENPIPTGMSFNALTVCLENVVSNTQFISYGWYDFDGNFYCQGVQLWECPISSEPGCLYLLNDSIYCNDMDEIIYEFTVCNPAQSTWPILGFHLENYSSGDAMEAFGISFAPSAFNPGTCQSFSTTLVGSPGEEFCFSLIAIYGSPIVSCESELYCVELPNCGPCIEFPWYPDLDGDGYGNPDIVVWDCFMPVGYVDNGFDCDDENILVNPDAAGTADGVDNNCNGVIDEDEMLPTQCPGDFNEDGLVSVPDLLIFLSEFGCTSGCTTDLSGDGESSASDLLIFLAFFGSECP